MPGRMVATLGEQPQVITLALDLLLERGEPIKHVRVLHTTPLDADPGALAALTQEFEGHPPYAGIELVRIPVVSEGDAVPDITTVGEIQAVMSAFFHTIADLKHGGVPAPSVRDRWRYFIDLPFAVPLTEQAEG